MSPLQMASAREVTSSEIFFYTPHLSVRPHPHLAPPHIDQGSIACLVVVLDYLRPFLNVSKKEDRRHFFGLKFFMGHSVTI